MRRIGPLANDPNHGAAAHTRQMWGDVWDLLGKRWTTKRWGPFDTTGQSDAPIERAHFGASPTVVARPKTAFSYFSKIFRFSFVTLE